MEFATVYIICYGCVGLLLRTFDERSRTNIIHLRGARLIHKLPRDMEDESVLINANWMPLKYFYCSRILNITHRAFYNIELDDVNRLVVKNASSYSLRKSLNIVVSRPRTEQGRRSFKHRAAIAWNSLPDSIRQL